VKGVSSFACIIIVANMTVVEEATEPLTDLGLGTWDQILEVQQEKR
jgi:hypothetical protein